MPDPALPLQQRRRAAQTLRDLIREVATAAVDDSAFAPIADALERLRDGLAHNPRLQFHAAGVHNPEDARERSGTEPAYDRDPLVGLSNALAPPLVRLEAAEGTSWEVTLGEAYQGHPGLAHGGYVAAIIDQVLGVTASSTGSAVMTGTLTTRYRAPTPLHTRLFCSGHITSVEGRKVLCKAELTAGGTLLADAEAIFILVPSQRL